MDEKELKFGYFIGDPVTRWVRNDGGDDRNMELLEDFTFVRANGERHTARKGLIFDGASIPEFLWSIFGSPFTEDHREAAIIHDQGCKDKILPPSVVHRVFYEAMRASGMSYSRAYARYAAVKLFKHWRVKKDGI